MNNFPKSYRRILFSFSNITDNVFQDTEVTHLLVDFFAAKIFPLPFPRRTNFPVCSLMDVTFIFLEFFFIFETCLKINHFSKLEKILEI